MIFAVDPEVPVDPSINIKSGLASLGDALLDVFASLVTNPWVLALFATGTIGLVFAQRVINRAARQHQAYWSGVFDGKTYGTTEEGRHFFESKDGGVHEVSEQHIAWAQQLEEKLDRRYIDIDYYDRDKHGRVYAVDSIGKKHYATKVGNYRKSSSDSYQ